MSEPLESSPPPEPYLHPALLLKYDLLCRWHRAVHQPLYAPRDEDAEDAQVAQEDTSPHSGGGEAIWARLGSCHPADDGLVIGIRVIIRVGVWLSFWW